VVTSALSANTPVFDLAEHAAEQDTDTVTEVGGAFAPIVPVKVKLSVAEIVKACAPLIVPEIF